MAPIRRVPFNSVALSSHVEHYLTSITQRVHIERRLPGQARPSFLLISSISLGLLSGFEGSPRALWNSPQSLHSSVYSSFANRAQWGLLIELRWLKYGHQYYSIYSIALIKLILTSYYNKFYRQSYESFNPYPMLVKSATSHHTMFGYSELQMPNANCEFGH